MKSKRSIACDIPPEVKQKVYERDNGLCIICGEPGIPNAHYIRRSQGGLGIEQNVVTLCRKCHGRFDDGFYRENYGERIKNYLSTIYPNWKKEDLIYNKWKDFNFN